MEYTYKRKVLYRNRLVEVVKITMKPGEETPVHEHGAGISGVMKVLKGEVFEMTYHQHNDGTLIENDHTVYRAGEFTAEQELGVHKVGNCGEGMAEMLFIYSPPPKNKEVKPRR